MGKTEPGQPWELQQIGEPTSLETFTLFAGLIDILQSRATSEVAIRNMEKVNKVDFAKGRDYLFSVKFDPLYRDSDPSYKVCY